MSVIFILITCSLLLAGGFLGAFLWASKSGQFEDDYTPSIRILFDEGLQPPEITEKVRESEVEVFSNEKNSSQKQKT
ncbi:MAG: cbb3-type cytochrome oxidase assembly protein CcoS [Cyclobacteriaceae bacterium]